MNDHSIAILGAGSWGTAIAIHLASAGHHVYLWGRDQSQIAAMQRDHVNARYLPHIAIPKLVKLTSDLDICKQKAIDVIIAIPSHGFAELIQQIDPPVSGISWLSKGLNNKDNHLLSQVVAESWGEHYPAAVISGPSFAKEVAKGLPTALTIASNNSFYQKKMQRLFHHGNLRIYLSHDFVGVQLCGAVKNIIAIACGISDGLGFGANARAALITRGLVELRRLGRVLGAHDDTFQGLAGLGDMILTCTDNQSRNRRYGLLLGQGKSASSADKEIGQVVEGKQNVKQICDLALNHHIEMPICQQVKRLLAREISPEEAVSNLMSRAVDIE